MKSRAAILLVCLGVFLVFPQGSAAKWVRSGKLEGISVLALAVNGDDIFAGTDNGVFRSTDNGANWTAVNSGLPEKTIFMCLAASGARIFAGSMGKGVFLSTDRGASWKPVNSGLSDLRVMSLMIDGEKLFAATTGGGVFLSTDNGVGWAAVNSGLPEGTSVNCIFKSGNSLFAGMDYRGLFVSTDSGASWKEIKSIIAANNPVSCLIGGGENLLAGSVQGIFRSTDGGLSWEPASLPFESAMLGILPQTSVMCLAVSGSNIFAGTDGAGVFMSSNQKKSWVMVNSGLKSSQVCALAVSGDYLIAGTMQGGIWRSPLADLSGGKSRFSPGQ
jgi:photosystem II stability/assembly factor-like uncharacterized protein